MREIHINTFILFLRNLLHILEKFLLVKCQLLLEVILLITKKDGGNDTVVQGHKYAS